MHTAKFLKDKKKFITSHFPITKKKSYCLFYACTLALITSLLEP